MQAVKVTIELGNEAMQTRQDIADALREVAQQFLDDGRYTIPIMDRNGNKVGQFEVVKQ
jgi:hypothetical protein